MRLLVTLTALLVVLGLSAPVAVEAKVPLVRQSHRPARLDSSTDKTKDDVRYFPHFINVVHAQIKREKHLAKLARIKKRKEAAAAAAAAQAAAEAAAATPTTTPTSTPTTTTSSGSYSSSSGGTTISEAEAASAMAAAGFPASVIPYFINTIIPRESGFCPTAVYGYGCTTVAHFYAGGPACSLFQLKPCPGPEMADPYAAARYAYVNKYAPSGLSPWGG